MNVYDIDIAHNAKFSANKKCLNDYFKIEGKCTSGLALLTEKQCYLTGINHQKVMEGYITLTNILGKQFTYSKHESIIVKSEQTFHVKAQKLPSNQFTI